MRVLLSTYDSRGGVEPLVALAVRLRELGAEARVCAPPDCAERLAEVGVPLVPVGQPVRPLPGRPLPPDVTDKRVLNDLDVQSYNALFGAALNTHRASIGLPPVDNVRDHVITDHPWLAADPTLAPWQEPADLDVVQTGAWILPDERPLPAELEAFLDAGRVAELGIGAAHDGPTPTTVAGTIRTDGATVAATLLLDAVSREAASEVISVRSAW
jgi:hypothetical protein